MLKLRALEPTDIDLLFDLENQEEHWKYSSTVAPLSRHALQAFMKQAARADLYALGQVRLIVYDPQSPRQEALALVDLTNFSLVHRRAEVGILVLPEHRQQGVALKGLSLLANYATKLWDLQQIYAYTHEDNLAANLLFQRAGFAQTAQLQQWFKVGRNYHNAFLWTKLLNETA